MNDEKSPHSVATWLLCEVRDALLNNNREPIQRAYVAAGSVAWDDCCGMLVVAPERVYRSQLFPNEFADREICDLGWLNLNLVVLLVRCVPVVDDRGRAPSQEALDAAYKNILEDSAVVWNTLQCMTMPDEWDRAGLSQSFVGADGGCIGVESRITIGIPQAKWRMYVN